MRRVYICYLSKLNFSYFLLRLYPISTKHLYNPFYFIHVSRNYACLDYLREGMCLVLILISNQPRCKASPRRLRPTSNVTSSEGWGEEKRGFGWVQVAVVQKVTSRIRIGRGRKGKGGWRNEGGKNSAAEKTESINLRSRLQPPSTLHLVM